MVLGFIHIKIRYTDAFHVMTNKRKLHESVIATTVRSNKIKSASRMNALKSSKDCGDDDDAAPDSDGGIDGVTISDMFSDENTGQSKIGKSYRSGGLKKKGRKNREDASEFVIPSRPSAAAAAAGECSLHCARV